MRSGSIKVATECSVPDRTTHKRIFIEILRILGEKLNHCTRPWSTRFFLAETNNGAPSSVESFNPFVIEDVQYSNSLHVGWRGYMSSPKSRVLVLVQSCQVESWGLGVLLRCLFCVFCTLYSVLSATRWNSHLGSPLTRNLLHWVQREIPCLRFMCRAVWLEIDFGDRGREAGSIASCICLFIIPVSCLAFFLILLQPARGAHNMEGAWGEACPFFSALFSPLLAIDVRGPCWLHSFPPRAYPELPSFIFLYWRVQLTASVLRSWPAVTSRVRHFRFQTLVKKTLQSILRRGRHTCILLQPRTWSELKRTRSKSRAAEWHDEKRLRVQLDAAGEAGAPLRRGL